MPLQSAHYWCTSDSSWGRIWLWLPSKVGAKHVESEWEHYLIVWISVWCRRRATLWHQYNCRYDKIWKFFNESHKCFLRLKMFLNEYSVCTIIIISDYECCNPAVLLETRGRAEILLQCGHLWGHFLQRQARLLPFYEVRSDLYWRRHKRANEHQQRLHRR